MKRISMLALLLLPCSLFASDVTGTFERGTRYEPPADHAPASVSRMYVRTLTRDASSVDLPAAGGSGMLIWTVGRGGARLTTPSGDVLRRGENGSIERGLRRFRLDAEQAPMLDLPRGTHEVLHVMQAQAASYRLDVDLPADAPGVMVVAAEPDSPIALETWVTPLSRQPGEPVTLYARLTGEITGARVTARVGRDVVELIEKDGAWTATLNELPDAIAGLQQVRFEADGTTTSGARFARTGSGEFVAERGIARLLPGSIRTSRADGVLRVTASADVVVPGAYRFDVIIASGDTALAWGEGVRRLDRGANELVLDIPLGATAADLQLDVRLLGLDAIGVAGRAVVDVRD